MVRQGKRYRGTNFPFICVCKTSCLECFDLLSYSSIVKYVCFAGKAAIIPECQIEALKKIQEHNIENEVIQGSLQPGEKVMVADGPLSGTIGELFRSGNTTRVIVIVDSIGYSLIVNVRT